MRSFILLPTLLIMLISILLRLEKSQAESTQDLTIRLTYNDKPPYYYTDNLMKPTGFLLKKTLEIFKESKIKYTLQELPSKRIQYEIKNSKDPHCSIGWFKTAEREIYGRFSDSIYKDEPMAIVTNLSAVSEITKHKSLETLFADTKLTLQIVDGVSYGNLDPFIAKRKSTTQKVSNSFQTTLKMINADRGAFTIVDLKEFNYFRDQMPINTLQVIKMKDLRDGNHRYIMCNKATPDWVIERLNIQIQKKQKETGKSLNTQNPPKN